MRAVHGVIWDTYTNAGLIVGDNRSHGRVTVEPSWNLNEYATPIAGFPSTKLPIRWFQRANNDQAETEIPNVIKIRSTWGFDTDAATCDVTIRNQKMTFSNVFDELGKPGYLSPDRAATDDARARWNQTLNEWAGILVEGALIRSYQGFGGHGLSITDAVNAGNLILTGTWIVDNVQIGTDNTLTLKCRSMAALLIDQPVTQDLIVPTPAGMYPLNYSRFYDRWIESPAAQYGNIVGNIKWVVGMGAGPELGYWIAGSDGGIFTYGLNFFYGSMGGATLSAPMVGMAVTPTGGGYLLASSDGGVFAFGDAQFLGSLVNTVLVAPVVEIETHPTGAGYYLVAADGGVFCYGTAAFHGSTPGGANPIVDIAVKPNGSGYWLVSNTGQVYAYGGASFYGGSPALNVGEKITGMETTATGLGYWLTSTLGGVFSYGDAAFYGSTAAITLNDPVTDIVRTPTGAGYWLVAQDGGIFAFGDAPFLGSLVGTTLDDFPTDGNYLDFTDIVKDLLRWAGFYLYDAGATATVYGNIESSGTYSTVAFAPEVFDKRPVMDGITAIKEILGYQFWVDEEGAARFESPNWFTRGNYLSRSGSHTLTTPSIDERKHLTDYTLQRGSPSRRSAIRVLVDNPDTGETEISEYVPPDVSGLRSKKQPAQFYVPVYLTETDRLAMAKMIAMHIWFTQYVGSIKALANPLIQIGDQVRIWERQTADTYIHYVRGITFDHDLESGVYTMDLQTHRLGDDATWAADMFA